MSTFALTLFSYDAEIDGKKVPVGELREHVSDHMIHVDRLLGYCRSGAIQQVRYRECRRRLNLNSMHPSYYYNAHCCILVFDVTRKVTYMNLNTWYKELQDARKGIPVIVVANKIDVDYKVSRHIT